MKRNFLYAIVLLVSMLLFTACNKDVKKITGNYSYKQSGLVCFTDEEGNITSILSTKRGQLNIVADKHGSPGDVMVTFNEVNGAAYSCAGVIKGDSIILKPFEFSTRFSSADSSIHLIQLGKVYTIQSAGRGVIQRHQHNIMMVEEQWTGHPEDGSLIRLKADKITLLAEEN